MRKAIFLILLINGSFCHHAEYRDPVITTCLEQKIEAFKQEHYAEKIIRIQYRSDLYLYWFKDSIWDAGEDVVDESCNVICLNDCECQSHVPLCSAEILDHPQTVIWSR